MKSGQFAREVGILQDCGFVDKANVVVTAGADDILDTLGIIWYDINISHSLIGDLRSGEAFMMGNK